VDELEEWEETGPPTPLLDTINYPVHLKNLGLNDLKKLCKELGAGAFRPTASGSESLAIRLGFFWADQPPPLPAAANICMRLISICMQHADLIHSVAKTGGHLGSSLGVVELTLALHYVFNTPEDKIIYDVGHQAYIHKILTGRRSKMHTIRQQGGLSGALPGSHNITQACPDWYVSDGSASRAICPAQRLRAGVSTLPQGLPNAANRLMILLALATAPLPSQLRWAWPWAGTSRAGRTMLWR
jgi:hypothetical protein